MMKRNSRAAHSLSVCHWLKNKNKWLAPILPYLAVWAGLFLFKSAWFALIGFHVAILFVLVIARPNIPISVLFKSKHPKWILATVLLCGSGGLGLYFLWDIFGIANDLPAQLQSSGLTSSWPVFIAYFALLNPFIEEYFWRAYLGSATKSFYISDLLYAGFHGLVLTSKVHPISILFALTCLTFIGWLWRQVYREDSGLLAPVLGHMAADFTILLTIYRMSSL
jgi:membrane protease YdiL (CAAX protease family)